jgi:osmotically-inducible protein OsmY
MADSRGRIGHAGALVGAAGFGAVLQHFVLDRQHAKRRRHMARDQVRATMRRRSRDAVRRAKYVEGKAEGVVFRTAHAVPGVHRREQPDDVTLSQKVESCAFRKAHVPKGHVSVNAENGVVFLRGQLEREEQIEALVRFARRVDGVKGVKSLLHTPNGSGG